MKNWYLLFLMVFALNCSQGKQPIKEGTAWQMKMNADFKDATKSPLKNKDRKTFKGLDFFTFDSTLVVTATLKRTPDTEWFNMKTTTDRISLERVFGVLTFKINGKLFQLNVYQGKELMTEEGFENYLFLPFIDNTNGISTYGGGRYIDLKIPEGDSLILDFNTAYNPYCAYNEKYSCPIVPRENYIDADIKAGVKMFVKE
ncbi:DUF1684 domain-containing protein [Winogradskyella endarachnes]|uniref:DUF1684 domain-containing protein n=1 Tax=Winogradskyella endarachnes TaxID=2681965 RepID=A0A6L6U7U0_9FLAO|nr:DUF1684 domain-containing protein [Winogradskyella endarachnes]MUU78079.1 DUF1684 domain-containing protein [Winogradskyella endarachnes]